METSYSRSCRPRDCRDDAQSREVLDETALTLLDSEIDDVLRAVRSSSPIRCPSKHRSPPSSHPSAAEGSLGSPTGGTPVHNRCADEPDGVRPDRQCARSVRASASIGSSDAFAVVAPQ